MQLFHYKYFKKLILPTGYLCNHIAPNSKGLYANHNQSSLFLQRADDIFNRFEPSTFDITAKVEGKERLAYFIVSDKKVIRVIRSKTDE